MASDAKQMQPACACTPASKRIMHAHSRIECVDNRWQVLSGGHAARDFQDERFSYVVISRGTRTHSPARQLPIAPFLYDDPRMSALDILPSDSHAGSTSTEEPELKLPAEEDASEYKDDYVEEVQDEAVRQLMLESIMMGDDEEETDVEQAMQAAHELLNRYQRTQAAEHGLPSVKSNESHGPDAGTTALPAFHLAEPASIPNAAGSEQGSDELPDQGSQQAEPSQATSPAQMHDGASEETHEDLDEAEGSDDEAATSLDAHWQSEHAHDVALAASASSGWSRIIRQPRKRAKHVLVDFCTAHGHKQGRLARQAVGAIDRRTWLGPAGYRMVRKSRWGDLWPHYHQQHAIDQL